MARLRRGRGRLQDGADQIDVDVGLNLRRLRLARGYSQTELGDALGVSFQQVQKYERGVNRVSASMLVKAARFLGVQPADLLPEDEAPSYPQAVARRFAEVRGVAELVNAYCEVEDQGLRRAVLQFVRAIAAKSEASAAASSDAPR
jgi:transcriptional regulator with XRE-family HTH domain